MASVYIQLPLSTSTITGTIPVVTGAKTPSYGEALTIGSVSASTITAPSGASWVKIQADDANTVNVRVKIGGTATASSGIQMQPGRSEDFEIAGDISVIAESGSNKKIYVQFGV